MEIYCTKVQNMANLDNVFIRGTPLAHMICPLNFMNISDFFALVAKVTLTRLTSIGSSLLRTGASLDIVIFALSAWWEGVGGEAGEPKPRGTSGDNMVGDNSGVGGDRRKNEPS